MRIKVDAKRLPKGKTDWKKVDALTDAEIRRRALSDPDNPPLTKAELKKMRPVPWVKAIRHRLGMSQSSFAKTFGLSLSILRDWEQRRCEPDQAAKTLLKVIEADPRAVMRALEQPLVAATRP